MANWAQMYDWQSDVDRVPELLGRLEHGDDDAAWSELGHRLMLERDLVSPAGIAALPHLVRLAPGSTKARHLAGEIMERSAGQHGCDDLLADSADAIAEFGIHLDRHLESRPADYLVTFRALLAVREQYHWANVLGDFTDDFYDLLCPHCATQVTLPPERIARMSAMSHISPFGTWDSDHEWPDAVCLSRTHCENAAEAAVLAMPGGRGVQCASTQRVFVVAPHHAGLFQVGDPLGR
ncbi:hypothetical protein ACIRQO_36620 [Streptomyces anulatus]